MDDHDQTPVPRRRRRWARRGAGAATAIAACVAVVVSPGLSSAGKPVDSVVCDRSATDAETLDRAFDVAKAGETICLSSGSYGTFRAGRKPGRVTVRSRPGATASMELDFDPAVNVRVHGVVVTEAMIAGPSENVTVSGSRFTGLAAVEAEQMADAGILFDGNRHADIDTCASCRAGRVHVSGDSGRPSGVVIRNSLFSGGNSDGVRADADGVQIIRNVFRDMRDEEPFHTDPIQLYGGERIVIRGNLFVGGGGGPTGYVSAAVMMADGGAGNLVEDNVVTPGNHGYALTWYSDVGSIIRHNTFADGRCAFRLRCGAISLGAKTGDPEGRGTAISDNVMAGIRNGGGGRRSAFTADHNLTLSRTPGVANLRGAPSYVGPPTTYAGYRLKAGSRGKGNGSNGRDRGRR